MSTIRPGPATTALPHIVAVGFKRINKMLQELAPDFADRASVDVLDMGFEQAVGRIRDMQAQRPIDVVVSAGSNGAYLRQHLDMPVVLVKVGGFDVMQALARARRVSPSIGLVTYEGMAPDLAPFAELLDMGLVQRTYRTEDDAQACVQELKHMGVQALVGPGLVADLADQAGLAGVFLYSTDAVREALEDAVEVARAARIELAKRERLNTILAQLSDGVIAVDQSERIQTLNPTMAQWLGVAPHAWLGRKLTEVCPELSLLATLRMGTQELEKIERVKGKALIVNRMPIMEQGVLTGAVLTCQDPISIQRVDRHIRTRIKPNTPGTRYELKQFLGDSAAVLHIRQVALSCARSQATVLLIGESGTGKELIAQGIHMASDRRDMPFVAVNCAAVSESLLESELFGYEEGAFTGARRGGKIGLFEAAHNGTLFLDEVGEMPFSLQTRLLRVLQEREVLRVGGTEPTPVNVRVIAATHQALREQVDKGLFRLDLYYRLNILRVDVPPLRERLQDIGPIAHALHRKLCARLAIEPRETSRLMDALIEQAQGYGWPGNVRELENLIERVMAYAGAQTAVQAMGAQQVSTFLFAAVPELFDSRRGTPASAPACGPGVDATSLSDQAAQRKQRVAQAERAEILRVMADCAGDRALASQMLGISRTTLWRKLKSLA
ncbi:MAG: propionate catabolism operon regulatory protein PrpR [Aquabacterium sp.]|uniref:propionate catabolism operon regulatory protein PrpR n=1 Tax=Aquabacterium sp. TaxID=1872578 RepID=UPI0025C049A2|nr:propionate catabolism operon regulatory protein PrpR [Aquabacterium sp.]MBI5925932.1 propionate catabolism operon regulatory protein PrpR [Aquabacterium sp.]